MAVTTFQKYGAEFVHKAREKRWIPRDFKYEEGAKKKEGEEVNNLTKEERKLWGEALRLGSTGYSESAMTWMHVLALRVFVETVLRYGLPAEFVCGIVEVGSPLEASVCGSVTDSNLTDDTQTREKSQGVVRLDLRLPRRQCHGKGQEGQADERRLDHAVGDASGRRLAERRVHAVRVLRL